MLIATTVLRIGSWKKIIKKQKLEKLKKVSKTWEYRRDFFNIAFVLFTKSFY